MSNNDKSSMVFVLSMASLIVSIIAIYKGERMLETSDVMQTIFLVCLIATSIHVIILAFALWLLVVGFSFIMSAELMKIFPILIGITVSVLGFIHTLKWWFSIAPFEVLL